jgi:hypothetical protein
MLRLISAVALATFIAVPTVMAQPWHDDHRHHHPSRHDDRHFHPGRHYDAPPYGWHRYHSRPWDWETRGCIVVGPFWFCP